MTEASQKAVALRQSIRAAVLENDRFAKEGIIAELESNDITVVGSAGTVEAMVQIVNAHQPEVVIVDLKLSREDQDFRGLDGISAIKHARPTTRCIVVTAFPSMSNFRASVVAGAEGFIAKENSVQSGLTMGEAVRRVIRGERCYDGDLVAQYVLFAKLQPETLPRNPLSEREQQVLKLVELSNEDIALRLMIAESTVKAHLKNATEKLELAAGKKVHNRYEAAELARMLEFLAP